MWTEALLPPSQNGRNSLPSNKGIHFMHVICLSKRWEHHTESGGYDRLGWEIAESIVTRCEVSGFWRRAVRLWWRRQSNSREYLMDYHYEDWLAELSLLVKSRLRRPDIVHVLYGDEQLDLLLRKRWFLPCPIVSTFHLPSRRVAERFEKRQRDELRRLDGAIVVSSAQLPAFRDWLGAEKVVFIPHGIDIHTFRPAPSHDTGNVLRLAFVGSHMRDFALTHRVIDRCQAEKLRVQFEIVTSSNTVGHFTGCGATNIRGAISEGQLIALYQSADALFLPVTDATANNSILESLACGTPIITTDVGGMRDYVDASCGWLLPPGDVDAAMGLLHCLVRDRSPLISRREAARKQAEKFSWERVIQRCFDAYKDLLVTGNICGNSPSG